MGRTQSVGRSVDVHAPIDHTSVGLTQALTKNFCRFQQLYNLGELRYWISTRHTGIYKNQLCVWKNERPYKTNFIYVYVKF